MLGSWLNPAFFEWVVNPNTNTPRMQVSHSEDSSIREMSSTMIRLYPTPLSPTFGIAMMQLHQNTQYKFNTAQHEFCTTAEHIRYLDIILFAKSSTCAIYGGIIKRSSLCQRCIGEQMQGNGEFMRDWSRILWYESTAWHGK